MKFEELKRSIKEQIYPCYIINGGESYLTTTALKTIENTLNLTMPDFNKTIFTDESQKSAQEIVEACQVMPFCDERRLVVVQDYLNKKSETERKVFANYLKKPNLSTVLVFFSTSKNDFFTSLEPLAQKIECEKLSLENLFYLANEEAKNLNLKFSQSALKKLLDFCNYSPTKVVTEINKFKSILIQGEIIEEEDIEQNVAKDIEYVIFDLTNAISQKQNEKAFTLIDAMLKNKEQPSGVIATISNHFRRLFLVSRSEFSNTDLASMLNVKEYAVSKYREQASRFSQKALKSIFDKCVEVEFMIKSGAMEAKNSLNFLLAFILN